MPSYQGMHSSPKKKKHVCLSCDSTTCQQYFSHIEPSPRVWEKGTKNEIDAKKTKTPNLLQVWQKISSCQTLTLLKF